MGNSVFWTSHRVTNSPLVEINLIIVSPFKAFITKKVDFIILSLNEFQAEGFIPTQGEYIKGDLTSDGVAQPVVRKLGLKCINHSFTNQVFLVVFFKIVALVSSAVSANWADIEHPIAILDKSSTLDRDIEVCDIV